MAENVERAPIGFARSVQRIAQVPKAKVDALEAVEREQRRKAKPRPTAQRPQ